MTNDYKPNQATIWDVESIGKWHEATFPKADLASQLLKLEEEFKEYNDSPSLKEAVDIYIVACALVHRWNSLVGLSVIQTNQVDLKFLIALDEKMQINMKRIWVLEENGTYHHVDIKEEAEDESRFPGV